MRPSSRRPPLLSVRNTAPLVIPARSSHSSRIAFTHGGTGTVRSRLPLPTRSGSTQRASRSWMRSTSSATSSARRRPHPISSARMARSRQPMSVDRSGAFSRQPVPLPGPEPLGAADARDAGGKFGREQSVAVLPQPRTTHSPPQRTPRGEAGRIFQRPRSRNSVCFRRHPDESTNRQSERPAHDRRWPCPE
jgi:hypothetical protein